MALTMRMIVDCAKLAGGVIGFGGEISWPGPVRPGDELSVECEIIRDNPVALEAHPRSSPPSER